MYVLLFTQKDQTRQFFITKSLTTTQATL